MKNKQGLTIFVSLVVLIVLIIVILAITLAGSPAKQRLNRLDDRRESDLNSIMYEVVNYWRENESLPMSLTVLENRLYDSHVLIDPETEMPYTYEATSATEFTLCANFALAAEDPENYPRSSKIPGILDGAVRFEKHTEGQNCFQLEIDREYLLEQKSQYPTEIRPPIAY
jgi:hypothetical protein